MRSPRFDTGVYCLMYGHIRGHVGFHAPSGRLPARTSFMLVPFPPGGERRTKVHRLYRIVCYNALAMDVRELYRSGDAVLVVVSDVGCQDDLRDRCPHCDGQLRHLADKVSFYASAVFPAFPVGLDAYRNMDRGALRTALDSLLSKRELDKTEVAGLPLHRDREKGCNDFDIPMDAMGQPTEEGE